MEALWNLKMFNIGLLMAFNILAIISIIYTKKKSHMRTYTVIFLTTSFISLAMIKGTTGMITNHYQNTTALKVNDTVTGIQVKMDLMEESGIYDKGVYKDIIKDLYGSEYDYIKGNVLDNKNNNQTLGQVLYDGTYEEVSDLLGQYSKEERQVILQLRPESLTSMVNVEHAKLDHKIRKGILKLKPYEQVELGQYLKQQEEVLHSRKDKLNVEGVKVLNIVVGVILFYLLMGGVSYVVYITIKE